MSSMSFSTGKQFVRPPQRGIFPLDHDSECRSGMEKYLGCLKESKDMHYKCRELSREYLQCRMDNQLMHQENLDNLGYSEDKEVKGAKENDRAKEKAGFIAGKHIHKKGEWWFQQIGRQKKWVEESSDSNNNKEGGDKPDPS